MILKEISNEFDGNATLIGTTRLEVLKQLQLRNEQYAPVGTQKKVAELLKFDNPRYLQVQFRKYHWPQWDNIAWKAQPSKDRFHLSNHKGDGDAFGTDGKHHFSIGNTEKHDSSNCDLCRIAFDKW